MQKPLKQKKCRNCGNPFVPTRPFETWCSFDCGVAIAQSKLSKKKAQESTRKRIEHREAKERIKTRAEYIKEAQQAFNAYIRKRDYGKPCICCGLPTKEGDHAGHWKPTSSSPELRFNEDNVHLQRIQCNVFLHGNVANYRAGLIQRIGLDRVEQLEAKQEPKKWSIEELKTIKQTYKAKLAALKNLIVD